MSAMVSDPAQLVNGHLLTAEPVVVAFSRVVDERRFLPALSFRPAPGGLVPKCARTDKQESMLRRGRVTYRLSSMNCQQVIDLAQ
jgi:hypothetical protein